MSRIICDARRAFDEAATELEDLCDDIAGGEHECGLARVESAIDDLETAYRRLAQAFSQRVGMSRDVSDHCKLKAMLVARMAVNATGIEPEADIAERIRALKARAARTDAANAKPWPISMGRVP